MPYMKYTLAILYNLKIAMYSFVNLVRSHLCYTFPIKFKQGYSNNGNTVCSVICRYSATMH